jgi:hypothetical protein
MRRMIRRMAAGFLSEMTEKLTIALFCHPGYPEIVAGFRDAFSLRR